MLLTIIPNTSWITAGASLYVGEGTDVAGSAILVTIDKVYVLTDGVEAPRLRNEEGLEDLGFEFVIEPWYAKGKFLTAQMAGKQLGQDTAGNGIDMSTELRHLRSVLQTEEVARLRRVSAIAAEIMDAVIRSVRPGMTEHEVAARLAAACRQHGGNAVVNLIASDERIYQYRHPLPTNKTIQQYVMAVLCLRLEGLIPAITRLAHFGPLPEELRAKALAVAQVDARLILGTRTGCTMNDMFTLVKQAYQDVGYPEAIEEHHQGGTLAYMPREIIANPGDNTPIEQNQAFAWNPSVRGVKSEDTIILSADGPEVITTVQGWPTWTMTVDGQNIARPAILER
jgi:antitoxin VapB